MESEDRQLEELAREEERALLEDPNVPDDVKVEIRERLKREIEIDLEAEQAEDAGNGTTE
jgi:hypothetical protein